jgi:hypothetical protein
MRQPVLSAPALLAATALVVAQVAIAPGHAQPQSSPRGGWNDDRWGNNNGWNGNGRTIRCESWNYRYARCNADTGGGVRLARVIAGDCRQGRNWGWSRNYIWVNNGCRAEFDTRGSGGGSNTGAVIAGVAVAAGLLALLASRGHKPKPPEGAAPTPPAATINVPADAVPPAAGPAFRLCLDDAARQISATGGTALRLSGPVDASADAASGADAWQFRMPLEGKWPNGDHPAPATCRATPTKLIEMAFNGS